MKKVVITMIVICLLAALVGCGNRDVFDTVYTYDYAIVSMPDGTVKKIDIKKWSDYEDGDQIQIIAEDGTVYLVHSTNCVLVREP